MSLGKRVTGTLGVLVAVGVMGLAAAACAPSHNPNNEGPPAVVRALSFFPDDPTMFSTLYLTDDAMLKSNCDFDWDGGAGALEGYAGSTWGFRIVLSELIDGDQVEPIADSGVGESAYSGFVQITTPTGGTVTSELDPTMQLTPDMLLSIYQPAGGSGCFGTVDVPDPGTGGSAAGPAIVTFLDGVPSLPSNSTLTLWLKKENSGYKIVDTGGTPMAADFKVDFTTDPMLVDCADITACNTLPYVDAASQPQDPLDPDTEFDMVTVQFNAPIGDPSGVYLYEVTATDPPTATLVPDVVASVDSEVPDSLWGGMDSAVSLTTGLTTDDPPTYAGIDFTPGATYWIVVTSDVLDLWGVPAAVTDVVDENGDPMDPCGDAAAAGITVDNCIWAGTFTVADAT